MSNKNCIRNWKFFFFSFKKNWCSWTCSSSLHGHLQSIGNLFLLCHAAKVRQSRSSRVCMRDWHLQQGVLRLWSREENMQCCLHPRVCLLHSVKMSWNRHLWSDRCYVTFLTVCYRGGNVGFSRWCNSSSASFILLSLSLFLHRNAKSLQESR